MYFTITPPSFDTATHLVQQGNPHWGIVHEAGNYPGAWWLDADNADLLVAAIMTGRFAPPLPLPVIPCLNRLPHELKVYRVIWRDWYRNHAEEVAPRHL